MRPVIRGWDPNDLDTARKVVSRAERRALDRAEEYSRRAEDLLRAVTAAPNPAAGADPPAAGDPAVEPETDETDATDATGESTGAGPPPEITEEAARLLAEAARQAEDVLSAALAAAEEADRARREASTEAARILAVARAEAVAAVEAARAEVEAARTEVEAARTDVDAARAEAHATQSVRDELASEMRTLRIAMERTKESFERFLAAAVEPDPTRL